MRRVVLLGGYGAVGRHAARELARWYPGAVVLAGRRLTAARAATADIPGTVPSRVDVTDGVHGTNRTNRTNRTDRTDRTGLGRALDGADAVVMCAERANADVARACLERGVPYVDVSADPNVLASLEELDSLARQHDTSAVMSVGLAPGVTNLLARAVTRHNRTDTRDPGTRDPDTPDDAPHDPHEGTVDIGVLLGSGEAHGTAALAWTLDGLGGMTGRSWPMRFPEPYGARTVHHFPFSDQHTLPRTLGVPAVRTGLCLDSRPLTSLLSVARRPAAVGVLRRPRVRAAVLAALDRVHLGGRDGFAATATAAGRSAALSGRVQSRATGLAAALVVRRLATLPAGVAHLDQLVDPRDFLTDLAAHGFDLALPPCHQSPT